MALTADTNTRIHAGSVGGEYVFNAQGAFGSGTLKLQFSLDGGTTKTDIAGASLTAAGSITDIIVGNEEIYLDLSGSTSPSINVSFDRVHQ